MEHGKHFVYDDGRFCCAEYTEIRRLAAEDKGPAERADTPEEIEAGRKEMAELKSRLMKGKP